MYLLYDLMSVLLWVKYIRYVRIIDHSTLNGLRFVANDLLYLQYFHMVKSLMYNTAYSIFTMTCYFEENKTASLYSECPELCSFGILTRY